MIRTTTLAALLLVNACSLLTIPAAAQPVPTGCTSDNNCSEPQMSTWPLDRVAAAGSEKRHTASSK